MTPVFPVQTRPERIADAVVHGVGLAAAVVATVVLLAAALPRGDAPRIVGLGIYAAGLLAMLACSALYNLTGVTVRKALYQRFDHAAIFAMIAGSYTPFALISIGGAWGLGLLVFVWTVAAAGILVIALGLPRPEALLTAAYLLLGWSILAAIQPLIAAVSPTGLALLLAGGLLYSFGTIFHHWRSLPFQNPIWHGFVVAAAGCHYAAVLREVAMA